MGDLHECAGSGSTCLYLYGVEGNLPSDKFICLDVMTWIISYGRFLTACFLLLLAWGFPLKGKGQIPGFCFAHVSDTHVGGVTGAEDLQRTVDDINSRTEVDFVVITGDVTEFGSEAELLEAKRLLSRLNKPWYVVPGNHDSKWSESGGNDFIRIFGRETFAFEHHGILFVGTASGPTMRMAPGQVPREQLVFLDSLFSELSDREQPVVFINHYPLDESLANSQDVRDLLKRVNTQVVLLGHGHSNKQFDFEGIPGIMGRSNLRASHTAGGYNTGFVSGDTLYYREIVPGQPALPGWCAIPVSRQRRWCPETTGHKPPIGKEGNPEQVRVIWEISEPTDIGAGIACSENICVYATSSGHIVARNFRDGSLLWKFRTGGKIYSTPAIRGKKVIGPSTDGKIYCLDLHTGLPLWTVETGKPIVASPVARKGKIFLGSSEGIFRALDLQTGETRWEYDSIRNFVETRPLFYRGNLYFGSWGNAFYALDGHTGRLKWKREKYSNRMLSPAAVWPVAAKGKVFIAAPDRHLTALDARTGAEVWDSDTPTCRESIGISGDGKLVYIKNMTEGNVSAFHTRPRCRKPAWDCQAGLGVEIAPSPISEKGNLIFVPTTSGIICAIDKERRQVAWKYSFSQALINHILPLGNGKILVTSSNGKVACLGYR